MNDGAGQREKPPSEVSDEMQQRTELPLLSRLKRRAVRIITRPTIWDRAAAVVLALLIAGPMFVATGASIGDSYSALFQGSFGSFKALGNVLNRADTFILLGLAIAIGVRAGFFNIGAEGQLWLGALGATLAGLYLSGPPVVVITVALIAGAVFGAIWSLLVGLLKVFFSVDELISSLMLNFVGSLFIVYLVFGPLAAYRSGQSESIPEEYWLPLIIPGTRLHLGFLLAVAAVAVLWLVLRRTTFGYEIRMLGGNPQAARFGGVNASWIIIRVSLIGGALAGLAGANVVLGVQHILLDALSPGYGYTALAVALLGALTPIGVFFAAVLFGALQIGATNMQFVAGAPAASVGVIEGLILVFFLIGISIAGIQKRLARMLSMDLGARKALRSRDERDGG